MSSSQSRSTNEDSSSRLHTASSSSVQASTVASTTDASSATQTSATSLGLPPMPPQLASIHHSITSQLNSIITSYSQTPVLMSSLQNAISNVLNNPLTYGIQTPPNDTNANPPTHSFSNPLQPPQPLRMEANPIQQMLPLPSSVNLNPVVEAPLDGIVENVLRFLSQVHSSNHQQAAAVQAAPLRYGGGARVLPSPSVGSTSQQQFINAQTSSPSAATTSTLSSPDKGGNQERTPPSEESPERGDRDRGGKRKRSRER